MRIQPSELFSMFELITGMSSIELDREFEAQKKIDQIPAKKKRHLRRYIRMFIRHSGNKSDAIPLSKFAITADYSFFFPR